MPVTVRGPVADVRWGYLSAATLGPWTLDAKPDGRSTVTAEIVSLDEFRIGQAPLTFYVERPGQPWTWPIESCVCTGTTLTATLGPQE